MTAGQGTRALVLFHGAGGRWYSRLLSPGFHHCFAAIQWCDYWIVVDPKPGIPGLHITQGSEEVLGAFYESHGIVVVGITLRSASFRCPIMAVNCVSVVKRLIGLRAPFVLTPCQLYRRLCTDTSASLSIIPNSLIHIQ
jgi:hypothetical protein